MTTSGSIDFSISRDDLIEESLMRLGVLPEGGAPTSDQLTDHSRSLNMLVKAIIARGIQLWAVDKVTLFLEQDKIKYTVGTDHIARTDNVARTTLASSASASASTISVSSATGIANTYAIGIELDDGTMQWTTVNGALSGTTVTLTTALTGAAAAGNNVYAYTAKVNALYIKSVIEVVRRDPNLTDVPISIIDRQAYHFLGSKTQESTVNQIHFQPNLTSSVITTYPESNSSVDTLEMLVKRTLEDFDAAGNTPDFPQEYYELLCWGLCEILSSVYRLPLSERAYYGARFKAAQEDAEGFDREQETSVNMSPGM